MMLPLVDGSTSQTMTLAVAVCIGIAFGWTLERAGLGSARKIVGQFHLTDFTVFKVMFSAIVTAMLGVFWLSRIGLLDLARVSVPETFWLPQLAGGLVFGAGFALGGLCPGTSCVSAVTGRGDGLAVVAGLFGGVLLGGLAFDRFAAFYERTALGSWTLADALRLPYGVVVLLVVSIAIAGFCVAERIERRP